MHNHMLSWCRHSVFIKNCEVSSGLKTKNAHKDIVLQMFYVLFIMCVFRIYSLCIDKGFVNHYLSTEMGKYLKLLKILPDTNIERWE